MSVASWLLSNVRPAALALRSEVISPWTSLAVEHRMAPALGVAPLVVPASFGDPRHQAVRLGLWLRRHPGECGARETERQGRRQKQCLRHSAAPPFGTSLSSRG